MKPLSKQLILLDNNLIDSDVLAFINAANITNATIINALNVFVRALKSYSLWELFYLIYPFVGGNATAHKFNLINPQDTDAARRITYVGGITHNANGVTGNGVNGFLITNYPANYGGINDISLGIYSRTAGSASGGEFSGDPSQFRLNLVLQALSGSSLHDINNAYATTTAALGLTATGFYQSTRKTSGTNKLFRRGTLVNTAAVATTAEETQNLSIFFLRTVGLIAQFSPRNISFAHVSKGFTDEQCVILNNLVQQLQTNLSRNIY